MLEKYNMLNQPNQLSSRVQRKLTYNLDFAKLRSHKLKFWKGTTFWMHILLFKAVSLFQGTMRIMCLVLITLTFSPSPSAYAKLFINVEGNKFVSTKVDFAPITSASNDHLVRNVYQIIIHDMNHTNLISVVNLNQSVPIDQVPNFKIWQARQISYTVNAAIVKINEQKFQLHIRVWNNELEKQASGKVITGKYKNWRRVSHIAADYIHSVIIGTRGYFDTKIAYIAENESSKRLAIMDQDGHNLMYLTEGKNTVLTPNFSKDGKKIAYMSFANNQTLIHIRDLSNNNEQVIRNIGTVNTAPKFTNDGKHLLLAISEQGSTNLYKVDLKNMNKSSITNDRNINTSPSSSLDSKKLVFSSDRSGSAQLYLMDINGKNPKRISFNGGSYYAPVWSPISNEIAFTKRIDSEFYIGVIDLISGKERLLTRGFMVDSPSWAPNGKAILFSRQDRGTKKKFGKNYLCVVSADGQHERILETPDGAYSADWSTFYSHIS